MLIKQAIWHTIYKIIKFDSSFIPNKRYTGLPHEVNLPQKNLVWNIHIKLKWNTLGGLENTISGWTHSLYALCLRNMYKSFALHLISISCWALYLRGVMCLYMLVQQKLHMEGFLAQWTVELFWMCCQMELHFKLGRKAEVTEQAAKGLLCWGFIGYPGEQR